MGCFCDWPPHHRSRLVGDSVGERPRARFWMTQTGWLWRSPTVQPWEATGAVGAVGAVGWQLELDTWDTWDTWDTLQWPGISACVSAGRVSSSAWEAAKIHRRLIWSNYEALWTYHPQRFNPGAAQCLELCPTASTRSPFWAWAVRRERFATCSHTALASAEVAAVTSTISSCCFWWLWLIWLMISYVMI